MYSLSQAGPNWFRTLEPFPTHRENEPEYEQELMNHFMAFISSCDEVATNIYNNIICKQ